MSLFRGKGLHRHLNGKFAKEIDLQSSVQSRWHDDPLVGVDDPLEVCVPVV